MKQTKSYTKPRINLSKYWKIETISCVVSDYQEIKMELHKKKLTFINMWKLNATLLVEEIKKEIKRVLEINENENATH